MNRAPNVPDQVDRAPGLEEGIARLLRGGTYLAIALIGSGVFLMLMTGQSPLDVPPALVPGSVVGDLLGLHPTGLLWTGLLVVLLTPAARVAVSLAGFARGGERLMAVVAALVLGVVAGGVVAGVVAGLVAGTRAA